MYALEFDEHPSSDAAADEVVMCHHCGSHFMVHTGLHPLCPECGTEASVAPGLDALYDEEIQEWAFAAGPGDHLRIVDTDWLGGVR